jgi:hypothetical protein
MATPSLNMISATMLLGVASLLRPAQIAAVGPIVGTQTVSGSNYSFRLTFEKGSRSRYGDGWGQSADQSASVRIVSFDAKYLGVRLLAKQSCCADLYNVRSVALRPSKGGIFLVLKGGDAGSAFTAELLFNRLGLVERIVRDGEFPNQLYERTIYHWVTDTM